VEKKVKMPRKRKFKKIPFRVGDFVRIKGTYQYGYIIKVNRKTVDISHSVGLKKGIKAPVSRVDASRVVKARLIKKNRRLIYIV